MKKEILKAIPGAIAMAAMCWLVVIELIILF